MVAARTHDDLPRYGTNVVPARMSREALRDGYVDLMTRIYQPEAYFERLAASLIAIVAPTGCPTTVRTIRDGSGQSADEPYAVAGRELELGARRHTRILPCGRS